MRWHPDKAAGKDQAAREQATERFSNIAEAFDVLTTPETRALLDKQGLVALGQNYTFTKDPQSVFENFFGTGNPFSVLQEKARDSAIRAAANPPAQVVQLTCTPEELYCGCIKRPTASRMVATPMGSMSSPRTLSWTSLSNRATLGHEDHVSREGDRLPGMKATELTFLVTEAPHEMYTRDGYNLVHSAKINLAQALGSCELMLRTLDGRVITVDCNHVIEPGSVVTVNGEGMCRRGDLIVHFDISFPKHLETSESEALTRILAPKFRKARK